MCKINGHNLFTYLAQPHNSKKLYTSKERAKKVAQAEAQAAETIAKNSDGDEVSTTATTAKIGNKQKKNQTLSSLRVPLQGNGVGASVGGGSALGLNLGG